MPDGRPRPPAGPRRSRSPNRDGLRWITTQMLAAGTVTPSLFDERDLAEVTSEAFPGERLNTSSMTDSWFRS